jgi:hypothetical protein
VIAAAGDVVDRKRFRLAGIGPTGGGILSRSEKLGRANLFNREPNGPFDPY